MRLLPALVLALVASISYGQATPELSQDLGPRSDWGPGLKAPPGRETGSPQEAPATPRGVVIRMKNGGSLEGLLIREDQTSLTLEIAYGTMGVRRSEIASIEYRRNDLQEFAEREARTDPRNPNALGELASWAQSRRLSFQARKTAERVLALDSEHADARAILGYEMVDGKWMTEGEAMQARGFVRHEGRWITRQERDAILFREAQEREARARREEEERRERETLERRLQEERRAQLAREQRLREESRQYYYVYPYSYTYPYSYGYSYDHHEYNNQHHGQHSQPHYGPHYDWQHGYHNGPHQQNHHDWHDRSHEPEHRGQHHQPHNGPHYDPQHGYHYGPHHQNHNNWHNQSHEPRHH